MIRIDLEAGVSVGIYKGDGHDSISWIEYDQFSPCAGVKSLGGAAEVVSVHLADYSMYKHIPEHVGNEIMEFEERVLIPILEGCRWAELSKERAAELVKIQAAMAESE